jgi:hypothetical protein
MNCADFEASLEHQLRAEPVGAAAEHVRECSACAAQLAARRGALEALGESQQEAPPPDLRARIGARLTRRRRLAFVGGSGATLALAAAAALVMSLRAPVGLTARGGASTPETDEVQLALLCYDAPEAAPDPAGHCRVDQLAGLALRRPATAPEYLAVIGFQGAAPRYYFPSPAEPHSRATAATGQLQPVGPLVRLGVNHSPGPLRLVGVLTPAPLSLAELEAATRGALPPGAIRAEATVVLREAAP